MIELSCETINLRVFRRNKKNTILIWDVQKIPFVNKNVSNVFIDESTKSCHFEVFKPGTPHKFLTEVSGVVVSHFENHIKESDNYKVKIVFEDGFYVFKEVFSSPGDIQLPPVEKIVHLYAYDYRERKWVPFPVDKKLLES